MDNVQGYERAELLDMVCADNNRKYSDTAKQLVVLTVITKSSKRLHLSSQPVCEGKGSIVELQQELQALGSAHAQALGAESILAAFVTVAPYSGGGDAPPRFRRGYEYAEIAGMFSDGSMAFSEQGIERDTRGRIRFDRDFQELEEYEDDSRHYSAVLSQFFYGATGLETYGLDVAWKR